MPDSSLPSPSLSSSSVSSSVSSSACSAAAESEPNAPVPASPARAAVAVSLFHTVPATVISVYFFCLWRFSSTAGASAWMSSSLGNSVTMLCFGAVLGTVLWSLFTLLSYWLPRVTSMLGLPHRAAGFLVMLPGVLLGPFYCFSLLGVGAFRERNRPLFLMCMPGLVCGYACLYGVLSVLAGEFPVTVWNAVAVSAVTAVSSACGIGAVWKSSSGGSVRSRGACWTVIGSHAVWLAVTVGLLISAFRAEGAMRSACEALSAEWGKALTEASLVSEYSAGGEATPASDALASAVSAGARFPRDGRLPELPEDGADGAAWLSRHASCFAEMDASTGAARRFRDDLSRHGGRYAARVSIVSNLLMWSRVYRERIRQEPSAVRKHLASMRWIRDSVLDDPYLLANGHAGIFERLGREALSDALSVEGAWSDAALSSCAARLRTDRGAWEERSRRAMRAALSWYTSSYQGGGDGSEGDVSPLRRLFFCVVMPLQVWSVRTGGCWAYGAARRLSSEPMSSLYRSGVLSEAVPSPADFEAHLLYGARMQFLCEPVYQEAAELAIACERYRRRSGSWPSSLSELGPFGWPSVPSDPFSSDGSPYRYERDGDGIRVYSVGPNGVDDGGREDDVFFLLKKPRLFNHE